MVQVDHQSPDNTCYQLPMCTGNIHPTEFLRWNRRASAKGILVKGSNYLEALSYTKYVVCDKTGTLTKGVFQVTEIHPVSGMSEADLLEKAALVESYSNHPISKSLKEAYGRRSITTESRTQRRSVDTVCQQSMVMRSQREMSNS